MRNTLSAYEEDGGYRDDQGVFYEDSEAFLQCAVLGFCGCGSPGDSLAYILRGLELIGEASPNERSEWRDWYVGHRARMDEHFKSTGAEYFFLYWCDKEGFTDHGGSVPGWLTESGRSLLAMLLEWRSSLDEGVLNEHEKHT